MKYPYEEAAKLGLDLPEGLTLAQSHHYFCLRDIYKRWQTGVTDKETALAEKRRIAHSLEVENNMKKYQDIMYRYHSDLRKNIEGAANAYAKNRTIENADKMYEVIYGMKLPKLAEVENGTHS